MKKLGNVPLRDYRKFLLHVGLKHVKTEGSHEKWVGGDLKRSVILQTTHDPVPVRIIKQHLRIMNLSTLDLLRFLDQ